MTSVLPGSRATELDGFEPGDVHEGSDPESVPSPGAGGADSSEAESGRGVLAEPGDQAAASGLGVLAEPAIEPKVDELTDRQRDMLVFERQWWRHAGSKEQAIRERFGLSATRYYQTLNALLDTPAALAFDPIVVGRLRRLRATRARKRSTR